MTVLKKPITPKVLMDAYARVGAWILEPWMAEWLALSFSYTMALHCSRHTRISVRILVALENNTSDRQLAYGICHYIDVVCTMQAQALKPLCPSAKYKY